MECVPGWFVPADRMLFESTTRETDMRGGGGVCLCLPNLDGVRLGLGWPSTDKHPMLSELEGQWMVPRSDFMYELDLCVGHRDLWRYGVIFPDTSIIGPGHRTPSSRRGARAPKAYHGR